MSLYQTTHNFKVGDKVQIKKSNIIERPTIFSHNVVYEVSDIHYFGVVRFFTLKGFEQFGPFFYGCFEATTEITIGFIIE